MADIVWALFDGYIKAKTEKAIGLAYEGLDGKPVKEIAIWLPLSQIGTITYDDGGDSEEIHVGKKIEAIEMPEWLANKNELEIE